jgi:hypothetical protein
MLPTSQLDWIEAWESGLAPSAAATRSAARANVRVRTTRYYGREATARVSQPAPEVDSAKALPRLKVVTRRRPRWGMAILALAFVALLLGGSIVLPMLVSSAATGVESAIGQMESRQKELAIATSGLSAQIAALSAPDRVAEQAAQLGLEEASSISYMTADAGSAATEGESTVAEP